MPAEPGLVERGRKGSASPRAARARRERGFWQRHIGYIHINPVKHGYVMRAAHWSHSSFYRQVRDGVYPLDWAGDGKPTSTADFGG